MPTSARTSATSPACCTSPPTPAAHRWATRIPYGSESKGVNFIGAHHAGREFPLPGGRQLSGRRIHGLRRLLPVHQRRDRQRLRAHRGTATAAPAQAALHADAQLSRCPWDAATSRRSSPTRTSAITPRISPDCSSWARTNLGFRHHRERAAKHGSSPCAAPTCRTSSASPRAIRASSAWPPTPAACCWRARWKAARSISRRGIAGSCSVVESEVHRAPELRGVRLIRRRRRGRPKGSMRYWPAAYDHDHSSEVRSAAERSITAHNCCARRPQLRAHRSRADRRAAAGARGRRPATPAATTRRPCRDRRSG